MRNKILSMGIVSSLALFLILGYCHNSYAVYAVGDVVSDFTLNDMNGNSVSLSDYRGYVILINFFAYN